MELVKLWLRGALLLALSFSVIACGGADNQNGGSEEQVDSLLIGTAGEGGSYYYIGQGVASVIEENMEISATAQRTGGGTENARRMSSGDMDVGFAAPADIERTVEDGTLDTSSVKVLMSGHATVMHIAVRADSDYESLGDLLTEEGTRFAVGEPGSAIQPIAIDLLSVYDLTLDDIAEQELAQAQAATALQNGTVAGAALGGGIPLAAASEVATQVGVRILPLPDEEFERLKEVQPGYIRSEIPGGVYEGTPDSVQTFAFPTVVLVSADLPNDRVAELTRTIIENNDAIEDVNPAGAEYNLDNAFRGADYYTDEDGLGLDFHPGAARYYEEEGVWSEEYE